MLGRRIENALDALVTYFNVVRGVGHTYTMANGAKNNKDAIVIAVSHQHGNQILKPQLSGNRIETIRTLDNLRGCNSPLAFDNFSLYVLFQSSLNRIRELEKQLEESRK